MYLQQSASFADSTPPLSSPSILLHVCCSHSKPEDKRMFLVPWLQHLWQKSSLIPYHFYHSQDYGNFHFLSSNPSLNMTQADEFKLFSNTAHTYIMESQHPTQNVTACILYHSISQSHTI
jgi:hypothetical protein